MVFETHNDGMHINGHVILIRLNLGSECDVLGVPNVIVLLVGLRSQDLTSLFHNSSTGGHVPHQGHIRGPGTIGSRSGMVTQKLSTSFLSQLNIERARRLYRSKCGFLDATSSVQLLNIVGVSLATLKVLRSKIG